MDHDEQVVHRRDRRKAPFRGTRITAEAALGERPTAQEEGAREAAVREPPLRRPAHADVNLPESARELLESDALAHLVTLNADGSPQVSCI